MKIHFIGIGGIGISAMAQYYLQKGFEVSGSDLASSEITDFLQKLGVKIFIGCSVQNITKDLSLVVRTPAVKTGNAELDRANELGIKTQTWEESLGKLTKEYFTIAVAGSHGKSTTTSMIALVLVKAGLDPTVIVGTKLKEFNNSNFRMGKSKYLVIEACEYDSSFLNYSPKIAVITNIDKEHLDYFKTYANVIKAFRSFAIQLPVSGVLVANADDKVNSKFKIQNSKIKIFKYSLKQKEAGKIKKLLKVPGKHNVSNALAVLAVTRELGIDDKIIFQTLSEFRGTWRRFETKNGLADNKKITVISDYGHHPIEVLATSQAAREKYPKKQIWCVFQPHQYHRTFLLRKDFIKIFKNAKIDKIIITDIYDVAGRENTEIKNKISSEMLVKNIHKKNTIYIPQQNCENYIKNNIKAGDILLIMGAGDIYKLYDKF